MAGFVDNLLEFFQDFLRCIREGVAELNLEYEPNRVGSLLDQLTEFERTLGLISSRVAGHESSDQLLQDLHQLTDTVRVLKERYQNRHVESNYFSFNDENAHLRENRPVEHFGAACRPRLRADKDVVQQLRNESMKWVDIARLLGISRSAKTLIRRRKEFEMPVGADAFTCMEDRDLDEHVRKILRLNPEAGTAVFQF